MSKLSDRERAAARRNLASATTRMNAAATEAQAIMDAGGRMRDVPPEVSKRHADALAEVKRYKAELGIKWDDDISEKRRKAGEVVPSIQLARALNLPVGQSISKSDLGAKIAEHSAPASAGTGASNPRNKAAASNLIGALERRGFKRDPWPDITSKMRDRWPLAQGARTSGSRTVTWSGPFGDQGIGTHEDLDLELIDARDGTLIRKLSIRAGQGKETQALARLLGESADTSQSSESHAGYASE